MTQSLVQLDISDGVAAVTLNRPAKRNALTREFIGEITRTVDLLSRDPDIRLLILASSGPVFCAGMDLQEMESRAADPDAVAQWRQDTQAYRDLLVSLLTVPFPTLAAVNGPALAGGFGMVLACDIVLATENVYFSLPEPRRGITAAVVAALLVYRIGHGPATYALLSGRTLTADAALRFGVCHEVAACDDLSAQLTELRASILTGSPAALRTTKSQIAAIGREQLLAQIDDGMLTSASARETGDAREGLAAFLERRNPTWQPDNRNLTER